LGYNKYIHGNVTMILPVYISKTKSLFFFHLQSQRTRGQNRSSLRVLVPVGGKEMWKGRVRVNIVQILSTYVCKWKNETC
jgi:hypothetical protein